MENKNQKLSQDTWIGLILILLSVGITVLNFNVQSPTQQFVYGLLTGMLTIYFAAFIYRAAKEYWGKSQ